MLRSRPENPWDSRCPPYSSAMSENTKGPSRRGVDVPRSDSAEVSASRTFATQPAPPSSATKRPPGLSTSPHVGDHRLGVLDPMKSGVAEDAIEEAVEAQLRDVGNYGVKPTFEGGPHLFGAAVDGDDLTPGGHQTLGQRTVAAPEVEHTLTWLWIEQVDDRTTEV